MPRVLHLKDAEGKPGEVYYPLAIREIAKPTAGERGVVVKLKATSLNHRDLFIRRNLYPQISLDHPLLADGYGTVVEVGPGVKNASLVGQNVLLAPMRGWESDPEGPEKPEKWAIIGSAKQYDVGMAQDYIVVDEEDVVIAPKHLSAVEGAALPLVGVTAWRALTTKTNAAAPGKNILVTGIGGGAALQLLQFGVAFGANVYVSSGSQDKIDKAKQMGAKGGVNYKDKTWEKDLRAQLSPDRPYLDAIIDGAGGDIVAKATKLLKPGGVISQYGMTVSPKMNWLMGAVLQNIELRGTTMGSRREFREMVDFVDKHKLRPVISRTVKGLSNLEAIDGLFSEMDAGSQFGKLVIEIGDENSPRM